MVTKYVPKDICRDISVARAQQRPSLPPWPGTRQRPLYVRMSRSVDYAQPDLVLLTTLSEFVLLQYYVCPASTQNMVQNRCWAFCVRMSRSAAYARASLLTTHTVSESVPERQNYRQAQPLLSVHHTHYYVGVTLHWLIAKCPLLSQIGNNTC